jgi:hypothetical protein
VVAVVSAGQTKGLYLEVAAQVSEASDLIRLITTGPE